MQKKKKGEACAPPFQSTAPECRQRVCACIVRHGQSVMPIPYPRPRKAVVGRQFMSVLPRPGPHSPA